MKLRQQDWSFSLTTIREIECGKNWDNRAHTHATTGVFCSFFPFRHIFLPHSWLFTFHICKKTQIKRWDWAFQQWWDMIYLLAGETICMTKKKKWRSYPVMLWWNSYIWLSWCPLYDCLLLKRSKSSPLLYVCSWFERFAGVALCQKPPTEDYPGEQQRLLLWAFGSWHVLTFTLSCSVVRPFTSYFHLPQGDWVRK